MSPLLTATQLRNARKRRAKKKNQSTTVVNDDDDDDTITDHNNNESYKNNVMKLKSQATTTSIHNNNNNNNPLMKEKPSQSSSNHNNNSKKRKRTDHNHHHHHHTIDPSQKYSMNPLLAPIIQRAQRFFDTNAVFYTYDNNSTCTGNNTTTTTTDATISHPNNKNKFPIYVGPIYGWRTVVKLPVRYTTTSTSTGTTTKRKKQYKQDHQQKQQAQQQDQLDNKIITIGLFAPGSHEVIPIIIDTTTTTNECLCRTHHPIINDTIIHIQQVARSLQQQQQQQESQQSLTAFSETTGDGYLRHIALSIQRHTNLVQLVIVWNDTYTNKTTTTTNDNDNNNNNTSSRDKTINNIKVPNTKSHDILLKFVQSLIRKGTDKDITTTSTKKTSMVQWHSIWVHYNNTWKHANAIFTHDGKWELVYHHNNNQYYNNSSNINSFNIKNTIENSINNNNNTNDTMNTTNANIVTVTDTNGQEQWSHLCPLGGITEYLTNVNQEVKEDEEYDNNNSITSTPRDNKYTTRNILTMINGKQHDTTTLNSINDQYNHLYQLPQHVPLHFPPHVFRQGNITSFTNIIQSIRIFIIHHFYNISIDSSNQILVLDNDHRQYRPSCLELYGGVGTIGLHIVDLCSSFICSDENPYNVQCFNASASTILHSLKSVTVETNTNGNNKNEPSTIQQQGDGNKPHKRSLPNIRYESASASTMILERMEHLQNHIDIIIVDPPRKGMDADVCYALTKANNRNNHNQNKQLQNKKLKKSRNRIEQQQQQSDQVLIYVSCGFDAFVRDYYILTQPTTIQHEQQQHKRSRSNVSNKTNSDMHIDIDSTTVVVPWKLIYAEGHVLFPGSDAIETLAIFTRKI